MSATDVLAQIKALPAPEQEKLARLLLEQTDWLEDVLDAATAKARMAEPERPAELLLREHDLQG